MLPFSELFMWAGYLFRIIGAIALALAFVAWGRRIRHWSMGVLALSFLLSAGLNLVSAAMWSGRRASTSGPTYNEVFMLIQQFGGLGAGVLLCVGAVGLLMVAREFAIPGEDIGERPPATPPRST